ncbi:multiprotein-bridging factor 1 family protein [Streptomyces coelicoflavus]|uniref:helix-turn-helix domain-containing protein n=1 Tax=Streptomyces coelicoflavus TaxID=285562 RepID=UPI0036AC41EB
MTWSRAPEAWIRLGERIRTERERLGLSQEDFAERVGVSPSSVLSAEQGRVPQRRWPYTLSTIEKGIGWAPGTMQAILAGEEPAPPSQQELGTAEQKREPTRPEAPIFRFRTMGWIREHGQEALEEVLPDVEKFGFLCTALDAPPSLVEAYERAVQELLDGVREAQGWPEEPPM